MTEWLDLARGPLDADDSFNLAVIRSAGGIVLGRKTRGYGTGRLVLPGGKDHYYISGEGIGIVPGVVDVSREVNEETGLDIDPKLFTQAAMLNVDTEDDIKSVAVYRAHSRQVPLTDSGEFADLDWYGTSDLPYDKMPEDYAHWLPHVLAGYAVTAFFDTYEEKLLGGTVYRQQQNPLGRLEMLAVEIPTT